MTSSSDEIGSFRIDIPQSEIEVGIDRLLTNVTMYWLTRSGGSSAQIYYENITAAEWAFAPRGTVPTGVLVSIPKDVAIRRFAEREHNMVHWSEVDRGGHFFAMEQPLSFASEVRDFFSKVG